MIRDRMAHVRLRARELSAFQQVFDSEAGQIVLMALQRHAGFLGSSYLRVTRQERQEDGMAQIVGMAFNDGQKDVISFILSQLKMDLSDVQKLIDQELKYERSASGPRQSFTDE